MYNEAMQTTIKVSPQIKESLDKIKSPGQSYNGIIEQLLNLWIDIKLNKERRVRIEKAD